MNDAHAVPPCLLKAEIIERKTVNPSERRFVGNDQVWNRCLFPN